MTRIIQLYNSMCVLFDMDGVTACALQVKPLNFDYNIILTLKVDHNVLKSGTRCKTGYGSLQ